MTEFLAVLTGIMKFWDQVTWLVKTLQKTPVEKHTELLVKIRKEADHFEETGRPTW